MTMKLNLRWEYGRRFNSNVTLFALAATVLSGILLAFMSPARESDIGDAEVETEVVIGHGLLD
jgi:hypothetical protein